ncbi:Ser/Thr protein kinase RdoA (MazF antagonist) [Mesorhizobium soli]|uniref:phosphotransferase n=1 Tax=Pseudaminobacter soli (ex Li et al. 2025) TaxID=1295366 RepID=UPI0024756818|nr:phosphotransferase [Mesorhizobium soli]MDH6233552.1 Ser/Thr protein kinase RdoA (MazF antagonist) [Mesorhizobium soli]
MAEHLQQELVDALSARACEALTHWGLAGQRPELLKYRENAVFRIALANGEPAALRIHRPGYHDEGALASELRWMTALRDGGLTVPSSVATADDRVLVHLPAANAFDAQHADIVTWMHGTPLGQSGTPLAHELEVQIAIFFAIGAAMAEMHNLTDGWRLPDGFSRAAWDANGLLGESPLWGRFWDCAGLSADHRSALTYLRARLQDLLAKIPAENLDYGLIHADLVRENVLIDGNAVGFIDFDDAGFGFRMFDIATALLKNRIEPHYRQLESALIAGYRSRRALSDAALATLPLFLTLRSVTYIGWLAARPEFPNAAARLARYADEALRLAEELPQ